MEKEKNKRPEEEFIEELLGKAVQKAIDEQDDAGLFGEGMLEQDDEHGEKESEHEEKPKEESFEIFEHGKSFFVPLKAVKEFAKALGRKPEEILKIYEKGCGAEKLFEEKEEAEKDSEIFERLAKIRGISKAEMRAEILGALEKAKIEKVAEEILLENPGMNRKTAEELAGFRLGMKNGGEKAAEKEDEREKICAKLRELDVFEANHRGEGVESLDAEVIEEWEKGIPLEKAFANFMAAFEKEKLAKEIEELKNERNKEKQKAYAKEHSTGSAASAAGNGGFDAFVEGLFGDY